MYKRILVTPEIASDLLKNNPKNRSLCQKTVAFYAKQMENDCWADNGETIKIAKGGRLLDGQHRLRAVIKSGVPVYLTIVSDLDDSVMTTIDTGKNRSAADVLSMNGVKYQKQTAEAIKVIIGYYENNIRRSTGVIDRKVSNDEVLQFYRQCPSITESCKVSERKGLTVLLSRSKIAAFHYLFSQINPLDANDFFEKLGSGSDLGKDHPILVLRNRLIESKMSVNKAKKMSQGEIFGLMVKAWNYSRTGKKVQRLSINKNEQFQRIM